MLVSAICVVVVLVLWLIKKWLREYSRRKGENYMGHYWSEVSDVGDSGIWGASVNLTKVRKTITPEERARRREQVKERRKANPLATDFEVADWLVACDYAKDQNLGVDSQEVYNQEDVNSVAHLVYTKYISQEVVRTLAQNLPHRKLKPKKNGKLQLDLVCFRRETLFCVLRFLNLKEFKYTASPIGRVRK